MIDSCAFYECSGLTSVTIPDSVTSIGDSAFDGCSKLTAVYYCGTQEDWNKISIVSSDNDWTTLVSRYYYSETQPTTNGNFWHYVDGVPTVWESHIHTEVIDAAVAPTCTETGLTEGKHCSECNEVLVEQEVISAEHKYVNGACFLCGIKETTPKSYFVFTELSDGTYSIQVKDINNMPAHVIIPSEYNGKAVTRIEYFGGEDLDGCKMIETVEIPSSIIEIGTAAFLTCSNLISVKFANFFLNTHSQKGRELEKKRNFFCSNSLS